MNDFKSEFTRGLEKANLKPFQFADCIRWAFGNIGKEKMRIQDLIERWNSKHGDIFRISLEDDIRETAKAIGNAWRKVVNNDR